MNLHPFRMISHGARPVQQSRGFTLLELLVAMAIFAFVAAMAYGGLNSVLRGNVQLEAQAERLAQLQATFMWLQRDLEQAVPRTVRDQYGQAAAAMHSAEYGNVLLELTRAGWENPLGQRRSQLQRVEYILEDKILKRRYWAVLDRAQDSLPFDRNLLDGVTKVELVFWDGRGEHRAWPAPERGQEPDPQAMPMALEFRIETEREGVISRYLRVAG